MDQCARRYGVLPTELLKLEPWELGLTLEVMAAGVARDVDQMECINSAGGVVFPVARVL